MKMETSAKLYSLNYSNVKTYLFALLFVAGNIALPQLCHLVPYGGPTLLPIYFFTLIAAYKYGFRIGLLHVSHRFGMAGIYTVHDFCFVDSGCDEDICAVTESRFLLCAGSDLLSASVRLL